MMNAVYLDTFSDNFDFVTIAEMEKAFDDGKRENEIEESTFAEYLENCMYWNNGALCPVADRVVLGKFDDGRLSYANMIYILRCHMRFTPEMVRAILPELRKITINSPTYDELSKAVDYCLNH